MDMWNGTIAQVQTFKNQTGATFPLLLQGVSATGGNLNTLYGPYDNYIVIDKQGIVRYHAADLYAHGNRYHLGEIRGVIDGLVSNPTGIGDDAFAALGLRLSASPNPFRGPLAVELENAGEHSLPLRITVLDARGRIVRSLIEGVEVSGGRTRFAWDGLTDGGAAASSGRYWIRAETGGAVLTRAVVLVR